MAALSQGDVQPGVLPLEVCLRGVSVVTELLQAVSMQSSRDTDGLRQILSNLCLQSLHLLLRGFLCSGTHGSRGYFQSFFPVCAEMKLGGGVETARFCGMKKLFQPSGKCLPDTFRPALSVLFLSGLQHLKYTLAACFQMLFVSTPPPCSGTSLAVTPAPAKDHRPLGCSRIWVSVLCVSGKHGGSWMGRKSRVE